MKKNRIITILGLILLTTIIVLTLFSDHNRTKAPTEQKGPGTVIIDNTDALSKILLPSQYSAVYDGLIVYTQLKYGNSVEHATLYGSPIIKNDGAVEFTVEVDPSKSHYTVVLDRSNFDKIILKVPSDNYSIDLKTYGSSLDGD